VESEARGKSRVSRRPRLRTHLPALLARSTNNATQPLRFASISFGPDHYGGLLDDVALCSRALAATEVKLHYDSGRQ
jgi:hypothetical protein